MLLIGCSSEQHSTLKGNGNDRDCGESRNQGCPASCGVRGARVRPGADCDRRVQGHPEHLEPIRGQARRAAREGARCVHVRDAQARQADARARQGRGEHARARGLQEGSVVGGHADQQPDGRSQGHELRLRAGDQP